MSGDGVFGPGSAVQGGGGFVHFLAASPSTIVGAGSWSALSVASFVPTGAVFGGGVVAGVLTLNIELKPEPGTGSPISAILEVICNVPIAGRLDRASGRHQVDRLREHVHAVRGPDRALDARVTQAGLGRGAPMPEPVSATPANAARSRSR